MFILLNGASDSLILFKFWNISHFLLSSFSEISNGHCLSSVVFPSLTACSIISWSKVYLDYAFAESYELLDVLFFPIFSFRLL